LVVINAKARLCNADMSNNTSKFITYTPSFRNDHSRVDWLFIVKTNPMGRVQVFHDGNDELIVGDDVF
jgi:hypothetical protein